MRNLTLCIVLLFAAATVQAQWGSKKVKGNGNETTENRTTSDYDKVAVAGAFDVELIAGNEGSLTLKGESNLLKHITTEVKDNVLKIKTKKGYYLKPSSGKKLLVTVPFKDISGVSLAGSGDVVTKDIIRAKHFKTSLAGSGDVELDVEASAIEMSVAGSGDMTLKGTTDTLETKLAGSGDIHAYGLKAKDVEAKLAGSGDIELYATNTLKARVSGSGDITYKGNPSKQDTKVSGSGDIDAH